MLAAAPMKTAPPASPPSSGPVSPASDTAPVRADERIDAARLLAFLAEHVPERLTAGPPRIEQFPGGHSNLTYCLVFADGGPDLVLRRPPLGPVAPSAHDMSREFRVLSKLAPHFALAPGAYAFCDDPAVLGAPFYLMERRHGIVIRLRWPAELPATPAAYRAASEGLLDALVALHDVDLATAGLDGLGHPDGFVERQVRGWSGRWERARALAREAGSAREVPLLDRLGERLLAAIPKAPAPVLLHNDFKFDNVMIDPRDPGRVVAILDWEMATTGDPLVDLGTLLGYWPEAGDPPLRAGTSAAFTTLPGFPTRAELVARYAAARGVDCSRIGWYESFALFKTAVVLEQIFIRFLRGQTRDPRFAEFETRVPALAEAAALAAERSGIP
jgi:aminoglycoside phosphotransferase (APT) family kinase protein